MFLFKNCGIVYHFMIFFSLLIFFQDDYLVSKPVKGFLAKYDKQLKKFNVSKALDTALLVGFLCFYINLVQSFYWVLVLTMLHKSHTS